ncbi:MAG: LPS export ABC transporter permease LptG [Rhodospirillaceae bacterium]|nr:LPS export ABC transporter permease LptG [Rhodospirillaceae bacterium]
MGPDTTATFETIEKAESRSPRPTRLSRGVCLYLIRNFLGAFFLVFSLFVGIILIVDIIELLRRASGKEGVTFDIVFGMALYKLPLTAQKTLPFVILFGGMLTFWRLNRTTELVILRGCGVSVWHFLLPIILTVAAIGTITVTLINPLGTTLIGQYEQLEKKYLKNRSSLMATSRSGVWLRQTAGDLEMVIHAKGSSVVGQTLTLSQVLMLLYDENNQFEGRIDAARGALEGKSWQLHDVWISVRDMPTVRKKRHVIPTTLTLSDIQESFSSPSSVSFWDLPRFIEALQETGFSALEHRLYWHSLIAEPVFYCAMILIAAVFSLRQNRTTNVLLTVAGGIGAGLVLFFISDLVLALANPTGLPAVLAAWAPAIATLLVGIAVLLHREDG